MSKFIKITGIIVLAMLVFGGIAFAATQLVFAQSGQGTQTAPAETAEKGLVVVAVVKDGPAAKAGVARGDILLKLNDTETNKLADLTTALKTLKPGDEVKLSLTHGDAAKTVTVKLGDQNGKPTLGLTAWGSGMSKVLQKGGQSLLPSTKVAGFIVTKVVDDSPAAKAGLKKGDIILAVNGKDVGADNDLAAAIQALKPGDKATLKVSSGKEEKEVSVTLGEKDGKAYLGIEYQARGTLQFKLPEGGVLPKDGTLPPGLEKKFSLPESFKGGALIQEVTAGGPAEKAGLKVQQVITKVDGKDVTTSEELIAAIGAKKPGDSVTLTVTTLKDGTAASEVKVTLGENPTQSGKAYLGVKVVSFGGFQFRTPGERQPTDQNGNKTNS